MTTMRDLLERRARLVGDMRAINDKPAGDGGDLSDDQSRRFDELRADLERTDKAIERQRLVDEADRRAAGEPLTGSGDQHFDRECRDFSLLRAIAGAASLNVDNGREREISAELQRRAGRPVEGIAVPMAIFEKRVVTSTAPVGGPGGSLIQTDVLGNQFIDILRAKLVMQRLGATTLNGLMGNVAVPRLKASAGASWIAENAAITASDQQIDQVTLSPKHCGTITEFSRNMILQASPSVEELARRDMAASLARAIDGVALVGGGSNEPTGIFGLSSGPNSVTFGAATWAKVLEFPEAVEIDNADGTGWVTNPSVVKTLRSTPKAVDGSSNALDSVMVMESPDMLAGYPLAATTAVPSTFDTDKSGLAFGQWEHLLIGWWDQFSLLVNPYESTAYSKGNVQVRALLTADVAVRHPEAFAVAKDVVA